MKTFYSNNKLSANVSNGRKPEQPHSLVVPVNPGGAGGHHVAGLGGAVLRPDPAQDCSYPHLHAAYDFWLLHVEFLVSFSFKIQCKVNFQSPEKC